MQADMEDLIIQLSSNISSTNVEDIKEAEVIPIFSNIIYGMLDSKEQVNLVFWRQPNKEIEFVLQANPSNQIERIVLEDVDANLMIFFEKMKNLNETQHSNIYKRNGDYLIYSITPLKDSQGDTIGVIGMVTSINELLFRTLKTVLTILIALVICSFFFYVLLKKWLHRTTMPFNEIFINAQELSSSEVDQKVEEDEFPNPNPNQMFVSINELFEHVSTLFNRFSNSTKELGTVEKDYYLTTMNDALLQLDLMMEFSKRTQELQRAEKMNAVGQLAASVAHEIRNPMTVVKGFLQIFYAKEHLSKEERLYIHLMIEEMDRAETIINDYLSLAKPNEEISDKVDGLELANKVIDLMQVYARMGKGIIFEKELQQVYIRASISELKQVLINLVKNAIEAMENGGTLSVSLSVSGNYALYQVRDTGVGMSTEELARLGTAFYSLKEKGTGMGLLVCYQMVEKMKGKMEVESEKGKGTTFKVYVPLFMDEKFTP